MIRSEIEQRAAELSELAARGESMPDKLTQPEQLYYQTVRLIYASYRKHLIGSKQGKREKEQALAAFYENSANHAMYCQQADRCKQLNNLFFTGNGKCEKIGDCLIFNILAGTQRKE